MDQENKPTVAHRDLALEQLCGNHQHSWNVSSTNRVSWLKLPVVQFIFGILYFLKHP